jgi:hypothetical protein
VSGARRTLETGCRPALLPEEELFIAQHLAAFADYGYAFDHMDLCLFVKSFFDKAGPKL